MFRSDIDLFVSENREREWEAKKITLCGEEDIFLRQKKTLKKKTFLNWFKFRMKRKESPKMEFSWLLENLNFQTIFRDKKNHFSKNLLEFDN